MRTGLAAGLLLIGVSAWAVSQEDFEAFFKKNTGMTHFVITSRRACTCHGGAVDGRAGIAIVSFPGAGQHAYVECIHPRWAADGQEQDEVGCVDSGGTVEVLTK